MSNVVTVRHALQWAYATLAASARLDAEVLLAAVAQRTRVQIIAYGEYELSNEQWQRYQELVARRARHEPCAYLLGAKEFYSRDFVVSPAVLVPRPETELLIDEALSAANKGASALRVLDLGTGSGCIAVTLACEFAACGRVATVVAVDKSEAALAVAAHNAARLGAAVQFVHGDWCAPLKGEAPFDIVVSNPPYIAQGDARVGPETAFEPPEALYSGADGLTALRHICEALPHVLHPHGTFLCEIGHGQGAAMRQLLPGAVIVNDLAGLERVVRYTPES